MKYDINYHYPENVAPTLADKIDQQREQELALRKVILTAGHMYNTCRDTAILASSADGYGNVDPATAIVTRAAGSILAGNIDGKGFGRITLIPSATKEHLQQAIQSRRIANILLVGHATYHSWMATDGRIDWYDAGKMVKDHLKDGTFANLGCVRSWNYIPLGRFVVGPRGRLLGKKKELTTFSEMADLANFQEIK